MSERERRYWGPYPGEVPLSRTSRPVPPPETVPDVEPVPDVGSGRGPEPEGGTQPEPVPAPEPEPEAGPQHAVAPDPPSGPDLPVHVADRAPSRADRRRDGNAMVPLLAHALTTQLAKLAADVDPVPDGWWFTPQR